MFCFQNEVHIFPQCLQRTTDFFINYLQTIYEPGFASLKAVSYKISLNKFFYILLLCSHYWIVQTDQCRVFCFS